MYDAGKIFAERIKYVYVDFIFFSRRFFQAAEMAIKKKALQTRGVNNFIAFLAFTFAGLLLGALLYFQTGRIWPETTLSQSFWQGIFWTVFFNLVAVYFLYKALDAAELSYLMPFMALTSDRKSTRLNSSHT